MTLRQIDEELPVWESRLAAVADNLLSLQDNPTFSLCAGSASRGVLTGKTARFVGPALGAVPAIFDGFNLLHSTILEARELRAGMSGLFGGEQKIAGIERLLHGKSVQIPNGLSAERPEQRSLTGGSDGIDGATPAQLLEFMTKAFAAANEAVLTVERAWRDLAEGIDRVEAQVRSLRDKTACADGQLSPSLDAVDVKLGRVREDLRADPVGALDTLRVEIQPELASLARLAEAAEQIERDLLQAHAALDELTVLHGQSLGAAEEMRTKIADPGVSAPVAEERLARLREWLGQLDHRRKHGGSSTLATGLKHWRAAAAECAGEEKAAYAANRAALDLRRELRGRLDALKAKARGRGVAERAKIAELAERGETLLTTRPTDLKRAAATVTLYAEAVAAEKER